MSVKTYKYVFGPVASRRLGLSLGVDLTPTKACPLDCIYCEVGRTIIKTARRSVCVPTADVLGEIAAKLAAGTRPDWITICGSGEPTLHSELGQIIAGIKAITAIPVAVITDGVLMNDPAVRQALCLADRVMPSLDAGDEATFRKINRPCPEVTLAGLVAGLKAFRAEYAGPINLEVFLIAGVNDGAEQIRLIRGLIDEIKPDTVDVNTVTRPPAESEARAVPPARLAELAKLLGPVASVIARTSAAGGPASDGRAAGGSASGGPDVAGSADTGGTSSDADPGVATRADVLAALARRPQTVEDLAAGLGLSLGQARRIVTELLQAGAISPQVQGGERYYQVSESPQTGSQ
jgi:wyosine [tRNA(Phe)-imidazoG37] synthetase (radical SAM superfamily)